MPFYLVTMLTFVQLHYMRLVSRCIRVRLLDPVLVTHSYVLDACPASPLMLKYIFIPECEVGGSKNICLSPLLAPSHMVILTEPSVVPKNATPEQREWISLQASDCDSKATQKCILIFP